MKKFKELCEVFMQEHTDYSVCITNKFGQGKNNSYGVNKQYVLDSLDRLSNFDQKISNLYNKHLADKKYTSHPSEMDKVELVKFYSDFLNKLSASTLSELKADDEFDWIK